MDTAIDVGNTRVKAGCFRDGHLEEVYTFDSLPFANWYRAMQSVSLGRCIIASVIPLPGHIIKYLSAKARQLIILGQDTILPVKLLYKSTATLGADRIALSAAAVSLYPGQDLLVISAGTCITYNFITANAEFQGGAISPGLHMRFKAMHEHTAALPLVAPEGDAPVIGTDTETSLRSGALNGMVFEIDGYIASIQKKYTHLKVIISGGDGKYLDGKLTYPAELRPELGLLGLYKIMELNVKAGK